MRDILITVKEGAINQLDALVSVFKDIGVRVIKVYPYGVIKGSAGEASIRKIKSLDEVEEVKEEKKITIAPPWKDIQ